MCMWREELGGPETSTVFKILLYGPDTALLQAQINHK